MKVQDTKQNLTRSIADNALIAIRKIIQSIALNSRSLVKRVGLTGPQLVVLQEVADSGEVSVGAVARAVSLSQGTVTDIVERMEKRGLVNRRRSDFDRRRVLVHATESGKQLLEKATPLMQESFAEKFNHLQDWEQTMILSSLQRLVAIMDARFINAEPILTTDFVEESSAKTETNK